LIDLAFFFEPPFAVVVDFFVTFVDVLAKDDVDFVLGAAAFAFG
jgi:hypothetical protein